MDLDSRQPTNSLGGSSQSDSAAATVPDTIKQQVLQGRGDRPRKEGRRDTGWIGADTVFEMLQKQQHQPPTKADQTKLPSTAEGIEGSNQDSMDVESKESDVSFSTGNRQFDSPPISPLHKTPSANYASSKSGYDASISDAQSSSVEEEKKSDEGDLEDLKASSSTIPESVKEKVGLDDFVPVDDGDSFPENVLNVEDPSNPTLLQGLLLTLDKVGEDFMVSRPIIYRTLGVIAFFATLDFMYVTGIIVAFSSLLVGLSWFSFARKQRREEGYGKESQMDEDVNRGSNNSEFDTKREATGGLTDSATQQQSKPVSQFKSSPHMIFPSPLQQQ